MILYCFGHISFNELLDLALDHFGGAMHPRNLHLAIFIIGFILMRLSGEIWWWSSSVESDSYYESFKSTKRFRLNLCREIQMQSRLVKTKDGGHERNTGKTNDIHFTKLEKLKRAALVYDIKIIRWFKRHTRVAMVTSLLGFYCTYIPCNYFYQETCLWMTSISRHEILKGLPSSKMVGVRIKNNPSPIFRSIASGTVGPHPLLSKEEMNVWEDDIGANKQKKPDMVLRREPFTSTSQTCSQANWTMETLLSLEDELYEADEEYLGIILSKFSYFTFFGDAPAYFVTTQSFVVTNLIIFTLSMFILAKAKIPFFEI